MNLETAELVLGSETPSGDGVTGATRCVLMLKSGERRAAVLKRIPRQAVLAEAFGALLLQAWGLTVPQPFLVPVDGAICFASADAAYPSLKQRLGLVGLPEGPLANALALAAAIIVAGLPQTPLALAADEAIDNRDRNLGNVLWDGAQEAWIDHELAFGLATHLAEDNKLATMAAMAGMSDTVKKSAIAAWLAIDRATPEAVAIVANAPEFAKLVSARLVALGVRVLNRFPAPVDLLSGA